MTPSPRATTAVLADTTRPSVKIINPAADSTTTLSNAGTILVQGTASDNAGGSGVKIVEVRTDTARL